MVSPLPFVLLATASSALARGILYLPGGDANTVTPLTVLAGGAGAGAGVSTRQAAAPVPLRILAVGASVTFGTGSSTGNSYRKDLRDMLVAAGQTVNFVGTAENGNFTDRQVEATPGFVIAQIAAAAGRAAAELRPNLVLVDAGTNNCNGGGAVPDAGANVTALVDDVRARSPGAAVVLATVLATRVAAQDACRVDVNRQFAALAADMAARGAPLVLVDMRGPGAPTVDDLADQRHPNDVGYRKMAGVWLPGIQEAIARGFVTAPADNGIPADGGA